MPDSLLITVQFPGSIMHRGPTASDMDTTRFGVIQLGQQPALKPAMKSSKEHTWLTGLSPAVGRSVTLSASSGASAQNLGAWQVNT